MEISGTSDDGIRIMINGVIVAEDWSDHAASTCRGHVYLQEGAKVPIRVDYYQNALQASAKVGWQVSGASNGYLQQVTAAASAADTTLVFVGIREGEGQDRAYLTLPGNQEDVIKAASASGKPVVVVLVAGSPVTMEGWIDAVPAILDAWYPGQEGADAIANVLFGAANPSGKLPMTFPLTVGQCPIYYNLETSGRGYDYVNSTGKPLFPFGFGLSYTTFQYSNVRVQGSYPFVVSCDVTNTGDREGVEVPQLYIHEQVADVVRPLEELEGFKPVNLKPGETKTVAFPVGFDQLSLWDLHMRRLVEAGKFDVGIGPSSADFKLTTQLVVSKNVKGEAITLPAGNSR